MIFIHRGEIFVEIFFNKLMRLQNGHIMQEYVDRCVTSADHRKTKFNAHDAMAIM